MKNQLLNKRIPTLLGIGLVVIGIILTTNIVGNQTILKSTASNSEEPKNVRVTNLSDNSFTITYQTDAQVTSSINYGLNKELGNAELDELDKEKGDFSPKNIHSITIKNLFPNTKYYLAIISGQNTFLNNGVPFEISTAPKLNSAPVLQTTLTGKVILPDGTAPPEALVYLNTDNSQLLSGNTAEDGTFSFSLKSLRSTDLSSYLKPNENTVLKLLAIGNSLQSTALISLDQANSIPTIMLSNDYDFTHTNTPVASKSAESLGFPSLIKEESSKPQILTPKNDQSFIDQQPQFSGTSLPNENVEIIIQSPENIQTQVTADSNGKWTYRPLSNLSPGAHTITIKTRDSSGILKTLIQSFTVFAQGSQVSESATPSATPVQETTPASTPNPTSLPSPTIIVIPTTIPIFTPTPFPSPTFVPISSKGGLPQVGNSSVVPLAIGGIAATITGIALLLLTHIIL